MTDPEGYVRNLKSINESIKRHSDQLKTLREKKKAAEDRLYRYMSKNNLDEYQGYKISKLTPKKKIKRKPEKEKKQDAIDLFCQNGIQDPETFWEQLKSTQKYKDPEANE